MILTGWKEIACYLKCSVRTVQRWEGCGLPIRRPTASSRAHVVAYSEDINRWLACGLFRGNDKTRIIENLERTSKLRVQVERSCEDLFSKLETFQRELTVLRARRHLLAKHSGTVF